jgi:hypothetical protein
MHFDRGLPSKRGRTPVTATERAAPATVSEYYGLSCLPTWGREVGGCERVYSDCSGERAAWYEEVLKRSRQTC